MDTMRLKVKGMTCGHCVSAVEKALRGQPGVREAHVDLANGAADVEFDEGTVTPEQLISAVREEGYEATISRA